MNELKVITNNVPRDVVRSWELPESVLPEFDYYNSEEIEWASFAHYMGVWYDLGQFMTTSGMQEDSPLTAWDGYHGDSYFSGVLVRFVGNDCEQVVMGRYVQ